MAATAFVLLAAGACQEPTQVELRLSTDLPCDGVHGTAVTVDRLGEPESAFPSASLEVCEPGPDGRRHLGLVVLVPRDGTSDDALVVKVVAAVTARSVDDCKPGKEGARDYQGCVVTRRGLRYHPGHTLRMAVPLNRECEGVECTPTSTCFDATTCIPAGVTCTKERCTIDDNPAFRFPNPSGPGSAAGGAAGGGGGAGGGASAGNGPGGGAGAAGQGGGGGGAGVTVATQVAAGPYHSCAIVENGEVRCWGRNQFGQLGDGTQTTRPFAMPVLRWSGGPPLMGVQALALGYEHSCALLSGGEVRCWGRNHVGQLGDGTITDHHTPVPVRQSPGGESLTGVQAVALGAIHSCALLTNGEVRCWGYNYSGQLGDGTTTNRPTPEPVLQSPGGPLLTGVQDLALGDDHSCALLNGGEIRCWGLNDFGQLGDGTRDDRRTPVPVLQSPGGLPLTGVRALAVGSTHGCALLSGDEARCWGDNYYSKLGDGTTVPNRVSPVPLRQSPGGENLTGVQALALGIHHSCALLSGGEVRCWGYNDDGQLGDGTRDDRRTPVPVLQSPGGPALTGVQSLVLDGFHGCALLSGGNARCWGWNNHGQLGDGTTIEKRLTPTPVPLLSSAVSPLRARPSARTASSERLPPLLLR